MSGSRAVNSFDADGHAVVLEGVPVTFDALGRAVEAAQPGGTIEFLYGPNGAKLAVMRGQTLARADIPLPGGGEAVYGASGLVAYRHPDHLGSSRLATTPTRTLYAEAAYAPYGEPYTQAGTADLSFTGQKQDISGGQYDFLMREYNPIQGRWWTPDPAGLAAVDPNAPQSWNRYAYVNGMPMEATDPLGLSAQACPDDATCNWNDNGCTVDGMTVPCGMVSGWTSYIGGGGLTNCNGSCPVLGTYISPVNGLPYQLTNGTDGFQYTARNDEDVDEPDLWQELGLADFNQLYDGRSTQLLRAGWNVGGVTAAPPVRPPFLRASLGHSLSAISSASPPDRSYWGMVGCEFANSVGGGEALTAQGAAVAAVRAGASVTSAVTLSILSDAWVLASAISIRQACGQAHFGSGFEWWR